MNKFVLVLILLSAISNSYAQRRYDLTFIASPQVSWMTSDSKYIAQGKSHLGYGYGIEGDIYVHSDTYLIVTGMTVSTLGGSLIYKKTVPFGGKILPGGTKVDYYLTNLEIPLALKLRTKDFNRTRFFTQFGLTNWFNVKTKAATNHASFEKQVVTNEIHLYNLGLNIGAGLEYELGKGDAVTGGLVYSDGFSDATVNSGYKKDVTTINAIRFRFGFIF